MVKLEVEQKPHRNGPCPCGSGKKYKKCCMAQDNQPPLKNTFRDKEEIEVKDGVILLVRDQRVMMMCLAFRKRMLAGDKVRVEAGIIEIRHHSEALQALPYSEGRDKSIEATEKQLAKLEESIAMCKLDRRDEVTLAALGEKFEAMESAWKAVTLQPGFDPIPELAPAPATDINAPHPGAVKSADAEVDTGDPGPTDDEETVII